MIILGTNSIKDTGGYQVDNSLRFNPASNDRLTRTPASSGNRNKWTWSGWAKRGTDNQDLMLFSCFQNSSYETHLKFALGGEIRFLDKYNGSTNGKINTLAKFRDLSAWYHIVVVFDTGNSTSTNKLIIYVNGIRITDFDGSVMPSNASTYNVDGIEIQIGALNGSSDMNGYISEVCFIDNQALGADSFGEFDEDNGIWKPIDVSGLTFGTNGYFLEFKESGTGTNASGMGADTSGNTHHFAVNGLTAIDQSTDTCTNNFATLNPLNVNPANTNTFSEGNLKAQLNGEGTTSTMAMASGNWYMEYKCSGNITQWTGVEEIDSLISLQYSSATKSVALYVGGATMYVNGANQGSGGYGSGWSSGDIGMIAFDADNARVYFGKNGGWWNGSSYGASSPSTYVTATTGKTYYFRFVKGGNTTCDYEVNFGGTQSFAISSGNTDGNDYGNFEYAVPSGYYSLCTKNLAEYG